MTTNKQVLKETELLINNGKNDWETLANIQNKLLCVIEDIFEGENDIINKFMKQLIEYPTTTDQQLIVNELERELEKNNLKCPDDGSYCDECELFNCQD